MGHVAFVIGHWRYYWRRYLAWFPVQFCFVCGKGFWGGMPSAWGWRVWPICWKWLPGWNDYCSHECAKSDMEFIDEYSRF